MLKVLVARERATEETRVAATPDTVRRMVKEGLSVTVEEGAGWGAHFRDSAYAEAGAQVVGGEGARAEADLMLRVAPLAPEEAPALKRGSLVLGFFAPHRNAPVVGALAEGGVTALAMELVPRITRAQKMDALSSQANIAGYKAALLGATRLGKYFPLLMTAAGTVQPARVVVLGAGVAGLQALATAKRLGAVVEVSDVRPAVKEQVASLGGKFIDLPQLESAEGQGGYAREVSADFLARQREVLKARIAAADVVITTAQVPGRSAPRLVDVDMVRAMRPGSVIIDLAAESGGNCELTVAGQEVVYEGVLVLGPSNLAASVPTDASALYSRNVLEVVLHLTKAGALALDTKDDIVSAMLLTHSGEVLHAPTAALLTAKASA